MTRWLACVGVSRSRKRRMVDEQRILRVLDGEPVELRVLCDWIRRTNPTGLALTEAERSQRYRFKAQLQSVLIERFDDQLQIRRTADPRIVGLGIRGRHGDAGHARLCDLSDAARLRLGASAGAASALRRTPR